MTFKANSFLLIVSILALLLQTNNFSYGQYCKAEFVKSVCGKKWVLVATLNGENEININRAEVYQIFLPNGILEQRGITQNSNEKTLKWKFSHSSKIVSIKDFSYRFIHTTRGKGNVVTFRDDLMSVRMDDLCFIYSLFDKEKKVWERLEEMKSKGDHEIFRFIEVPAKNDISIKIEAYYPYDYRVASHFYDSVNNRILFAMENAGISSYDIVKDKVSIMNMANSDIKSPYISSIRTTPDQGIWIADFNRLIKLSKSGSSLYRVGSPYYPSKKIDLGHPFLVGHNQKNEIVFFEKGGVLFMDELGIGKGLRGFRNQNSPFKGKSDCLQPIIRSNRELLKVTNDSIFTQWMEDLKNASRLTFYIDNNNVFYADQKKYQFGNHKWTSVPVKSPNEMPHNRGTLSKGLVGYSDTLTYNDLPIWLANDNYTVVTKDKDITINKLFGIQIYDHSNQRMRVVSQYKFLTLDEILSKKRLPDGVLPLIHPEFYEEIGSFTRTDWINGKRDSGFINKEGVVIRYMYDTISVENGNELKYITNIDSRIVEREVIDLNGSNLWIVTPMHLYRLVLNEKYQVVQSHRYLLNGNKLHSLAIKQIGNKLLLFSLTGLSVIDIENLLSTTEVSFDNRFH